MNIIKRQRYGKERGHSLKRVICCIFLLNVQIYGIVNCFKGGKYTGNSMHNLLCLERERERERERE